MSDTDADWTNTLACRWAEGHLKLPKGSVIKVTYGHESEDHYYVGPDEYDSQNMGSWTYMWAWLNIEVPDPYGGMYPVHRLDISLSLETAVKEMLALGESIIESGEKL
jgi:hypothetical protein